MKVKKTAVIVSVRPNGGLWVFGIRFDGVPAGFGLDGKRLRGHGPCFLLADVNGYDPHKSPGDYREFGPDGIATGVKIQCKVLDCLPQGLVVHNTVRPARKDQGRSQETA